ncbi:MAG: hypothetical protein HUU50_20065 [Candidatus Brocadiae bacterium]|nr:hypothetical protein [Candidatus Brocadiia bacterium]
MLANQKIDQEIMITIIYVIIDTICKSLIKTPKQEQKLTDAEVITIAICSALYFQSEHKKALYWLEKAGYFPRMISLSRFNRRIHKNNGLYGKNNS